MGNRTITLSPADATWLEATIARNRARFAGWTMEDPPTDPPADPPAPPTDPAPPADPPKQPPWGDPENFNAEKAWELIQNLRAEKSPDAALQAEIEQLKTAQQQQLDAIATALGLKPADTPPDPAALTAEIATERENARSARVELAVYKAATAADANPALLLDSASFLASLKDVDPADSAAVSAAITQAVETNPHFKNAAPPPPTPPFPGGPRPTPPTKAGSLAEAIANRISQPTR